jgi:hypothetical protein
MALMYGLHVVGVDASESYTHSANERNAKLNKNWDGFVKTAKSKGPGAKDQRRTGMFQKTGENAFRCSKNSQGNNSGHASDILMDTINNGAVSDAADKIDDIKATSNVQYPDGAKNLLQSYSSDVLSDKTVGYSQEQIADTCFDKNISGEDTPETCKSSSANTKLNSGIYVPLTRFIDSTTDLKSLVVEHLGSSTGNGQVLLTGLHTCGNLASSMLKMFAQNDAVGSVCNVGCCYQHLVEEFVPSPFLSDGKEVVIKEVFSTTRNPILIKHANILGFIDN